MKSAPLPIMPAAIVVAIVVLLAVVVVPTATAATSSVVVDHAANNVQGQVGEPSVVLLGVVSNLSACEALCLAAQHPVRAQKAPSPASSSLSSPRTTVASTECLSFTFHHTDFVKAKYRGHCYGRVDAVWTPTSQVGIDSGCRLDVGNTSRCNTPVTPPPPPSPSPPAGPVCRTDFDCAGGNGRCLTSNGTCSCRPGWQGAICGTFKFASGSARRAYRSPLWTWGGSPIFEPSTNTYHLFGSEMTNHCGILHYCINSQVIHLTAPNATGPFAGREVVLAPRDNAWDNGAIHGVTVHRLPNGTYALFYLGSEQPGVRHHPNCTAGSGDASANSTFGSHSGRRIGVALSDSLDGPWRRLGAPLFSPDANAWDNIDVSNPSPIILRNGSVVLLYKGRGSKTQHMGLAFADTVGGPYRRNASGTTPPDLPGEDPWGWVDRATGVLHAVFHDGNGADSAGSHRWSADGVVWHGDGTPPAYTGTMSWAVNPTDPVHSNKTTVLARRERPQLLLDGEAGSSYGVPRQLFTSAEDCEFRGSDGGTGIPCPDGVGTDMAYTVVETIMS
eukprot:m.499421 g.499421  ORF g.499421 m.499421 type:complete len:559 (-) comp57271_c0_seq1:53-1729(-)